MIIFSKQNQTFNIDCRQEWLETNGLGSYVSTTILDYPTRKYHGLLVAHLVQPYGKFVLLSHCEEFLDVYGQRYPLSIQRYDQCFETQAFDQIQQFSLQLIPCMHYQCGAVALTKETLFLEGRNTVLVKYCLPEPQPGLKLSLRPFLAYRSYHSVMKANTSINTATTLLDAGVQFSPYKDMPNLTMTSQVTGQFSGPGYWYYHFSYLEEKERGYDYLEDLFSPGVMEFSFDDTSEIIVAYSIEEGFKEDLPMLWQAEIDRRLLQLNPKKQPEVACSSTTALARQLGVQAQARAVHQVIIEPTPEEFSIEAGLHWFTQWGRDAMIALPGLTLYADKEAICLRVLTHFAAHESQGMIPNRLAPLANDHDEYDNVDGSLWFCWAVQQYYLKTQDLQGIQSFLWPALKNIIHFYRQGTRFGIHQASNGLIYAGNHLIKLTWMDVVIDGVALTPRNGAAVEINALWYNALCFVKEFAGLVKDPLCDELDSLIDLVKHSFHATFWNAELGYLNDFVNDQVTNSQLRPNQIIAASLPYCVLEESIARSVITVVVEHLLTPYGLRTLAVTDPNYHGIYEGDQTQRDRAYHNGTVWPWLLGPLTAALVQFTSKEHSANVLQSCVKALWLHFNEDAGIECISEIFDGDAPHRARGCIQQAWSVSEIIRMVYLLQ